MTRINITDNRKEEIPKNWSITELGDLLVQITNGLTTKQSKEPPGIPVTRIETISFGTVDLSRVRYITDIDEDKKEKFLLRRGDILFSHINSDFHLGKTAIVTTNRPLLHGMNLLLLRTDQSCLDSYYLHYLCNYYRFAGKFVEIAQHAVNQSSLNQKKIKSLNIPLAPLNEQKRIVAEIEKQFSRLDEAVDNLKRVKANLKRYKASVLKAAVEGKLTEEWRKKHPDLEPADKLLQRILAERRKKWEEAELARLHEQAARRQAKMYAKGLPAPKDDKWKKKYKEPPQVDTSVFPALPNGWVWATISQISSDTQIGLVRSKAEQNINGKGVGYIKMNNVTMDGRVIADNLVFVNADENEKERFSLTVGDILFNNRNSLELVGKVGLVKRNISDHIFNNNLMRIRVPDRVNSAFIVFQICSTQFREKMERVKRATTNVAAIYGKDLMPLSIVLPPSDEQIEISKEIEQHYSIVEEIETSLEANIQRAVRLRQSILKKAFSGQLVNQNNNNKLAAELLGTVNPEG